MLAKNNISGYGADEGAALMIQTDGDKQTITEIISKNGAKIYKLIEQRQEYINLGKNR